MQEARAVSALDHRNICTLYDIDHTDDQVFIVMAYYDGDTLQSRIAAGPLTAEESLDIAIQVADGLSHSHAHGIVHRDIKPANVLITRDGTAKIVDFGIAKLRQQTLLTTEGVLLGTAAYMSPEQARGRGVDHTTDIWSLGVVLYEMFTGRRPFTGEVEMGVIYAIVHEDPEVITTLHPGLSVEVSAAVHKALAKNPADRYQSMDEMLADLRELRSTGGTSRRSLAAAPRTQLPRSIAVLSFLDLSPARDQQVPLRRDGRGADLGLEPDTRVERGVANLGVRVQREGTGRPQHRAAAAGDARARRKRAQVRRAFAGHGAADCGEGRISALDPTLRPRFHRRVRDSGRHRPVGGECAESAAWRSDDWTAVPASRRESRRRTTFT